MVELRWGASTDPGRVRPANEDGLLAVANVFAVADGMGGHAAGEVASAIALQTVQAQMGRQPATVASVTEVVRAANAAVHRRSVEEPTARGMGTTLTLIAPTTGTDGRDHLVVANVGDSRAYLLADGQLRQLTRDHSYVEEMLAAGQITADEARRHPHRHVVTRALGVEPSVAVDTWLVSPEPGDRYLLCSDGLVNEVADEEIARIILSAADAQAAAEALVAAANEAGGRDNISVVVVEVVAAQGRRADTAAAEVAASATERVEAGPLGGWLPQDLAQGFEAPDTTDGPGSGTGGSSPSGRTSSVTTATATATTTQPADGAAAPGRKPPKRRRVTGRAVLFTALVAGVFVVALAVTAAFGRNGYFVGYRGERIAVYQGRPGGVLWFQPTVESVSDLSRNDLTADFQTRIARNPTFSSHAAADLYLEQLAEDDRALVAVTTTSVAPPSTPASTTTPPTTTSPPTTIAPTTIPSTPTP